MRRDEPSWLLMVACIIASVVGVGVILVGIGRHAGYNVAAALLTLLSALFGYRAWDLSTHRRLEELQRAQLLARLRQLPPTSGSSQCHLGKPCSLPESSSTFSLKPDGLREGSTAHLRETQRTADSFSP